MLLLLYGEAVVSATSQEEVYVDKQIYKSYTPEYKAYK
jgi:hypothetical protein